MTCTEALDLVEAIAAGDMEPDAAARDHFESCPRCAAALATARRIELALASREAPSAPARFTPLVQARIRRERWRSEQAVDRLFNVAIVAAVILVTGGVIALMNVSEVLAVAAGAWQVFAGITTDAVRGRGPSLGTYAAAVCLFASALAMWWWAERRLSL
jgi:anti-sigma factor RsiW